MKKYTYEKILHHAELRQKETIKFIVRTLEASLNLHLAHFNNKNQWIFSFINFTLFTSVHVKSERTPYAHLVEARTAEITAKIDNLLEYTLNQATATITF